MIVIAHYYISENYIQLSAPLCWHADRAAWRREIANNHANDIENQSNGESSRCSFQERPGIAIPQLVVELWSVPMRDECVAGSSWQKGRKKS